MDQPDPTTSLSTTSDAEPDLSLIRWMLALSPEERLAALQGFADSVDELTHAAEPA